MSDLEYLDHPPVDWFILDVLREGQRGGSWSAFLVDVHPDDMKNCDCSAGPAFLYVHPDEYRPGLRKVRQGRFSIPGKHRSRKSAWEALEALMATQH
jgi:hypothetical protein